MQELQNARRLVKAAEDAARAAGMESARETARHNLRKGVYESAATLRALKLARYRNHVPEPEDSDDDHEAVRTIERELFGDVPNSMPERSGFIASQISRILQERARAGTSLRTSPPPTSQREPETERSGACSAPSWLRPQPLTLRLVSPPMSSAPEHRAEMPHPVAWIKMGPARPPTPPAPCTTETHTPLASSDALEMANFNETLQQALNAAAIVMENAEMTESASEGQPDQPLNELQAVDIDIETLINGDTEPSDVSASAVAAADRVAPAAARPQTDL